MASGNIIKKKKGEKLQFQENLVMALGIGGARLTGREISFSRRDI